MLLNFFCSILLRNVSIQDLASVLQKLQQPICYGMALTADIKDPKFETA